MASTRNISRRDLLKAALMAGGAIALSPLLKACRRFAAPTAMPTPVPSPTQEALFAGLRGLDIDSFFQEAYRRWMSRDPENLTNLGLADLWGVGDTSLTDISDDFVRQTQSLESSTLDLLRKYDRSSITDTQALTADVFDWFLDDLMRGHAFMYDDYPVNPVVTSVPYNLYMLFTVYQPLDNARDANDYIARLSQVRRKMDQLLDALKRREQRNVVLPRPFFDYVLSEVNALARKEASTHDYFTAFTQRLKGVSEEERRALSARVLDEINSTVRPAYSALGSFLREQQPKAAAAVGVWQFPDGEAYYSQCLRRHTTTDLTAEQIHELGLQHVERVRAEIRSQFSDLGYPSDKSIVQLIQLLIADGGIYRGKEAVAAYEQAIDVAATLIPEAFTTLPRATVKVIGGRDGDYYMPASFDGSRPGLFFARTDGATPRFGVKTTGFHETIPGHHLQTALAQEVPNLPDLRRGMQFNAYTEGWALYAERLMWELGAYTNDVEGNLGRLQMEAYRAARLVIDTGIHAKRWTFGQAVDYLMEATGLPEPNAQREVTRYSVWPGQATSYYVGFLKLLELRQKASDALGSRFDLKAFHQAVLAAGSVPLPILERLVDVYIRQTA